MPAEILHLSNFDSVNESARSESASSAASAQKDIVLQSASGFVDERFVVIAPNTEGAELGQIDSLNGATLTLKANLTNAHPAGTRVLQLMGNQLKLYRADNVDGTVPDDADFSAYTSTTPSNPIDIQPDQSFTAVTDASGGSGYWYKVTYLNESTTSETSLSLAVPVRGGNVGHFATLEDIREESGFGQNAYVDDGAIVRARDSAEAEINGILATTGYTMPVTADVPLLATITRTLAAAHLLTREYGTGADGTNKDGVALKKDARDMLARILNRTIILTDSQGNLLLELASNDVTDTDLTCYREPTFRMGDTF